MGSALNLFFVAIYKIRMLFINTNYVLGHYQNFTYEIFKKLLKIHKIFNL
ncbi:hypothetical protein MSIBF_A3710003 [groundwater metagenome]|uniref:Uncharacterized protein n=1 Tax=groundwater metagenome TaxID=717931 RepID=A0A098ECT7_9ZZZZ